MALPTALQDREQGKFTETVGGDVAVRVSGSNFSGNFTVSGLTVGGRVTEVTLNASTWTALPSSPLANRNTMAIQNTSGIDIKLNYDNTTVGYVGILVSGSNGERQYDISDSIVIYAKSASGTPTVVVEELA